MNGDWSVGADDFELIEVGWSIARVSEDFYVIHDLNKPDNNIIFQGSKEGLYDYLESKHDSSY